MSRVGIVAGVTLQEAARKKVLLAAALVSAAYLALFGLGLHMECLGCNPQAPPLVRQEMNSGLLMVGLYGVAFLTALLAILAAIDSISGEIASGTIQAIATKPVRRWELVLGKWLGFAAILAAYVVVMGGGAIVLMRWAQGYTPTHVLAGLSLIWFEGLVLMSMTLLLGTFCSTLAGGVAAIGLYGLAFMGGWIEQIGVLLRHPTVANLGIATSLIMPSEALWRRTVFEMQSPMIGAALGFSPFSTASVPSGWMVGYAGLYLLVAMVVAVRHFGVRDL